MTPKTVLFVVNTRTYFTGLFPPAIMLKHKSRFKPVMLFLAEYPAVNEDIEKCRQEKIDYLCTYKPAKRENKARILFNYAIFLIKKRIEYSLPYNICELFKEIKFIKKILATVKPSVIVLGGDLIWYNTSIFIKIGHQYGIPSMVMAQWMANAHEPAEAILFHPRYDASRGWNKIVGRLLPRWLYTHHGRELIRLPANQVIAKELFKLAPPLPWILHSGKVDVIAVEGQAMADYGKREGLPEQQIRVTGSIDNDNMAASLYQRAKNKRELCRELNLDEKKPILLSALPPDLMISKGRKDLYYGTGRPDCEFENYPEMAKYWVGTLVKAHGYNVILNLHPSTDLTQLQYLADLGATLTKGNIAKLITLADIFVAGMSSTIQWAIACGVPTVNYDIYQLRYSDYDLARGVLAMEKKSDFEKTIAKLTSDKVYYNEVLNQQQAVAKDWGMLDGQSGQRILELINGLIKNNGKEKEK